MGGLGEHFLDVAGNEKESIIWLMISRFLVAHL